MHNYEQFSSNSPKFYPKSPELSDFVEISKIRYDSHYGAAPPPFRVGSIMTRQELEIYLQNNRNVYWTITWGRGGPHWGVELYIR